MKVEFLQGFDESDAICPMCELGEHEQCLFTFAFQGRSYDCTCCIPDAEAEEAVCIGCSRTIESGEAHNEVEQGNLCEACYQMTGDDLI